MLPSQPATDRRLDGRGAVIEHAQQLAHSFGWRYAMLFMLNKGLDLGTIDRVLFGIDRRRSALQAPPATP